jgi:hypothetical protein
VGLVIIAGKICAEYLTASNMSRLERLGSMAFVALAVILTVPAMTLGRWRFSCLSAIFVLSTCLNLGIENMSRMVDPGWMELIIIASSVTLAICDAHGQGSSVADSSKNVTVLRHAALMVLAICTLIGNASACEGLGFFFMFISALALSVILSGFEWGRPIVSFGVVYLLTRPMTFCHTLSSAPYLRLVSGNSGLCFFALLAPRLYFRFSENHLAISQAPAVDGDV